MLNLWQIPYLDTGALYPCCFLTMWDVTDGRLNCMLVQRSGDWGLEMCIRDREYAEQNGIEAVQGCVLREWP